MILGKFTKEPGERKRYTLDYSDWLETGETIVSAAFTETPSGALDVDSYAMDGTNTAVIYYVSGGLDGVTYEVECTITTSLGQIKQDQVVFKVKEL